MFYTPKYFKIQELVSKDVYDKLKSKGRLNDGFLLFDPYVLYTLDLLREKYGSLVVNNWNIGGTYSYRGYRTFECDTGALLSAHKGGRAIDLNASKVTPEEIRADMEKIGCFKPGFMSQTDKESEPFRYIKRIETTQGGKPITWFHFDTMGMYNGDSTPNENQYYFGDGSIMKITA